MSKFEVHKDWVNLGVKLPIRCTKGSAGYDIEAAEDILLPTLSGHIANLGGGMFSAFAFFRPCAANSLEELVDMNRTYLTNFIKFASTGLTIKLEPDEFLMLVPRSSVGAKGLVVLRNEVGIVDSDYYPNEIKLALLNLSDFDVTIKKGERIAQGIIMKYGVTEDDNADGVRTGGIGSTGG